jgi:hypothetical protein
VDQDADPDQQHCLEIAICFPESSQNGPVYTEYRGLITADYWIRNHYQR